MSPRRSISTALSRHGFGSLATMLLSTLAGLTVARNSGPSGYALFVAANMIVFVSAALCECSLPLVLSRRMGLLDAQGDVDGVRKTLSSHLVVLACAGVTAGLLVSAIMPWLEELLHLQFGNGFRGGVAVAIAAAVVGNGVASAYLGLLSPERTLITTAAGPALMVAYVLTRRAGAPLPLWGAVSLSYLGTAAAGLILITRDRLWVSPLPLPKIRPLLREIGPAWLFTYFTIFSAWSDRWVVGAQLGVEALGLYAAASAVVQASLRVPTNLAYALVPASVRMQQANDRKPDEYVTPVMGAYATFAAPVVLAMLLAGDWILRVLFGPGFVPASAALQCMSLSVPAAAITMPLLSVLAGSTDSLRAYAALAATIPIRLLLLFLGARIAGTAGAALATAAADVLLASLCAIIAARRRIIPPWAAISRLFGTAAIGYFLVFCLNHWGAPTWSGAIVASLLFVPAALKLHHRIQISRIGTAPEHLNT